MKDEGELRGTKLGSISRGWLLVNLILRAYSKISHRIIF